MTSSPTLRTASAILLACAAVFQVPAVAGTSTVNCEQITKDVHESVTKEPSKVLMIVEDALVINENCACEIVKTAITASNADTALAKQIVSTAIAVAPKQTAIIVECAEAAAPGSGVETASRSGKGVVNVNPAAAGAGADGVDVAQPKDGSSGRSGGIGGGAGFMRGVYLMQPAVGGFFSNQDLGIKASDGDNGGSSTKTKTKVVYVDKPRVITHPHVSESCPQCTQ